MLRKNKLLSKMMIYRAIIQTTIMYAIEILSIMNKQEDNLKIIRKKKLEKARDKENE